MPPSAGVPVDVPPATGGDAPPVAPAYATPEWADLVEYDDPELGEKISVYVPKDKASRVKDGYALKATMSRHATYLQRHKAFLEPLIAQGQFDAIAPVLQAAYQDPRLMQAIATVVDRYANGQPIDFSDPAVQRVQAAVEAPVEPQTQYDQSGQYVIDPDEYDPYTAEAVTKAVRPLMERVQRAEQYAQQQQAYQQQSQQQQAATQQQQAAANQMATQASRDLALRYPNEFSGELGKDESKLMTLHQYAASAGLYQQYGLTPAALLVAKMDLDAKRSQYTASPLAAVQANARAAGAQIANRVAGSVVNGGATQPPGAPQDPFEAIAARSRNADGTPRKVKDVARDVVGVLAKLGG